MQRIAAIPTRVKMYCGGCGAEVTTPESQAVYPCPKCGSTWRVSAYFQIRETKKLPPK